MSREGDAVRKELGFSYTTSNTKIRNALSLIEELRAEGESMPLDVDSIRYRDDVRTLYSTIPVGVIKGEIDRAIARRIEA